MIKALCAILALSVLASTGCVAADPNVTDSGAGKPLLEVDFPEEATSGEIVTATLDITNPGPEDIDTLVVAFVRVGDPSLPEPIVEPRSGRKLSGIEDIRPRPRGQSPPDATYTFAGLAEGESTTIEFDLRIPDGPGAFGNSVQVYDGAEPERADGARIETEVS